MPLPSAFMTYSSVCKKPPFREGLRTPATKAILGDVGAAAALDGAAEAGEAVPD